MPRIIGRDGIGMALLIASSKLPNPDAPNWNKALSKNGADSDAI